MRDLVHEINNPLSIIQNYLGVLDMKLDSSQALDADERADLTGDIAVLQQEVARVGRLARSLTSRTAAPGAAAVDINRLLDDVVRLFRQQAADAGIALDARSGASYRPLVERDHLEQVLVNLVKNAIEAIQASWPDAEQRPQAPHVTVSNNGMVNRDGRLVLEIGVRDNGPGMAAGTFTRIFGRRLDQGDDASSVERGRGLNIVQRLVESMDGVIQCRSSAAGTSVRHPAALLTGSGKRQPGAGAMKSEPATGSVPTAEAPHPRHLLAPSGQPEPGKPRLLLVDDEPRLIASLAALLARRGHHSTQVDRAEAAIELLDRQAFDLVLLDLHMPGLGGQAVLDHVNRRSIDVGVIVISGETDIDAAIGALRRGADDFIRKPYVVPDLLRCIDNTLQRRRLQAENRRMAERLEHSERLYRHLVNASPDVIYTIDPDGRFTFVNDRFESLLGFGRDALIGKHFSLLIHDDDVEQAQHVFHERRAGERASRNVELRLRPFPILRAPTARPPR